jgi:hypothetical protein
LAVCTATDLPVAWNARTARDQECIHAMSLIDKARERGFAVETCAMDKGYDVGPIYEGCTDSAGAQGRTPVSASTRWRGYLPSYDSPR